VYKRQIPESIEEERRLCYVGVTRAEDNLYISAPLTYQRSDLKASPFLSEMGFEVPIEYQAANDENQLVDLG
jgi:superfamily I DNA/RNA helicase